MCIRDRSPCPEIHSGQGDRACVLLFRTQFSLSCFFSVSLPKGSLISHKCRDSEIGKHNDSQHDSVIAEELEIMLLYILQQEFNGVDRDAEGHCHSNEQVEHLIRCV